MTLFKLFCAYFALSFLAGFVVTALGYEAFAARWLYTPPVLLVLLSGVAFVIALVRWG